MKVASELRPRLFFALWPDETVRNALASMGADMHPACGGRLVAVANIHLTLFFVGAVDQSRVDDLGAAAGRVKSNAFELTLDRLGRFRRSGVAWAGSSRCPPELIDLEASLRAELGCEGFKAEERPYAPHVTLIRDAKAKPADRPVTPCVWQVTEFVLVESVAVRGGVRYEPRSCWPLRLPIMN